MKGLDVEACAETPARFLADAEHLVMADLVAAGLARPDDVAVDLALGAGAFPPDRRHEEGDGALAAPTLGVHTGVDDETRRTKQEALDHADPAQGIVRIDAKLVTEGLGIKAIAFAKGRYPERAVEQGNVAR